MTDIAQWLTSYMHVAPPCLFHVITGLYCPGCGGTRAILLFFTGHWLYSFLYHPLVLYTFFSLCYIAARYTIVIFQKKAHKKIHPYRPSSKWLWGALIVLCLNFTVKNIALLCFHVDLLSSYDILHCFV